MKQINLFELIAEAALDDRRNQGKQSLDEVTVGDVVEVYTTNAHLLWRGRYVTRRHWRFVQNGPVVFYFQADGGGFNELTATVRDVIWAHVGHDPDYHPPAPEDVLPELTRRLQAVPLPERIATYQAYEKELPATSVAFDAALRDAWDAALIAATPLQDLMTYQKANRTPGTIPADVVKAIRETIWPLPPQDRRAALLKLSWPDRLVAGWRTGFLNRIVTYYRPILEYGLTHAATPEELVAVLRWWGTTTVDLIDAKGQRWIRQENGEMACIPQSDAQQPNELAVSPTPVAMAS